MPQLLGVMPKGDESIIHRAASDRPMDSLLDDPPQASG